MILKKAKNQFWRNPKQGEGKQNPITYYQKNITKAQPCSKEWGQPCGQRYSYASRSYESELLRASLPAPPPFVWARSISARWINYRHWSCHLDDHHHHMSCCNISAGPTGEQYSVWSSNPWMDETSIGFPDCGISCVPCKSKVQNISCKIQGRHPSILVREYEGESVENQASEWGRRRCSKQRDFWEINL